MGNDDQLQALERLAKLRDTGALSEEEFTAKKTALLNSPVDARAPFYRRLWFVVLLTCLILTFPIALIILSTGDIYRYKGSTFVPVSKTARRIYAALLALWLAALVIQAIFFPSVLKRHIDEAVETPSKPAAAIQAQATIAPAPAQPQPATAQQPATAAAPATPNVQPSSQAATAPKDPLENQYTAEFTNCLNTGDAAQGVTSAMVACTDAELTVQDAKLNATYKSVMAALDPTKQTTLRTAQRAWIKYRDSKCDAENQTGGTIDQVGRPSCLLDMTIQRTIELASQRDQ